MVCVCVCVVVVVQTTGCGCVWGGQALTVLQEVPCVLHGFLHIVQLCMGGRRVRVSVCLSVCLCALMLLALYSLGSQPLLLVVSHMIRAGGGAEGGPEVGEGQGEVRMWGGGEGQVQR